MTVKTDLTTAIQQRDTRLVAEIAQYLRFKFKMDYMQQFEFANKCAGIELADWDQLLMEGESHV